MELIEVVTIDSTNNGIRIGYAFNRRIINNILDVVLRNENNDKLKEMIDIPNIYSEVNFIFRYKQLVVYYDFRFNKGPVMLLLEFTKEATHSIDGFLSKTEFGWNNYHKRLIKDKMNQILNDSEPQKVRLVTDPIKGYSFN